MKLLSGPLCGLDNVQPIKTKQARSLNTSPFGPKKVRRVAGQTHVCGNVVGMAGLNACQFTKKIQLWL